MQPTIPKEDWAKVNSQIAALTSLKGAILDRSKNGAKPLKSESERWLSEFEAIKNIIMNLRDSGQTMTKALFDHDSLGPIVGGLAALTYLDAQLEEIPDSEVQKCINYSREKIQELLWTVEAMEFWSEEPALQLQETDIGDLLQEATKSIKKRFSTTSQKDRTTTITSEKDLLAKIHEPTLVMLLLNICSNAKWHGGAAKLDFKAYQQDGFVVIEISDDGTGIDDQITDTIFEWGQSGANDSSHHGIGLANAKERMAAMNGSIEAEPKGGLPNNANSNGAKFTIKIPKLVDVTI